MMIDIFCSLFLGLPFGPHIVKMYGDMDRHRRLGHVFAVWDISRFVALDEFRSRIGTMIDELHSVPPAEGAGQVLFPGELEGRRRKDRSLRGVPIESGLAAELRDLGDRSGAGFPS
jgi:ureidoglycolate dehydrogenase (NAD+)